VHGIQTVYDGIALRDDLTGLRVTIVDAGEQPMATMDPDMGAHVAGAIRGIGIELRLGTRVTGFETDHDGRVTGVASDAGVIPADIVVLGIGVRPASDLARDAGIAIGAHGGVLTDRRQSTSVEGVWAAGDCVETFHRITHERVAIALGTHANKQGRVAGLNATGAYAAFPGVIGTAITKICEYEIGRTGLNEREATRAGFGYETAKIESTSRAAYYPGAQPITVKVLAEKNSGRLLGSQVIGREGAGKRIDVMATAIWNGMLAEDFGQVDLSYAPPLSPLWDPTLIAARAAASALLG
jgi:NADPH-dependent 2,4-dienoyl-CoA reductase/sulfur reductase-like enzyme